MVALSVSFAGVRSYIGSSASVAHHRLAAQKRQSLHMDMTSTNAHQKAQRPNAKAEIKEDKTEHTDFLFQAERMVSLAVSLARRGRRRAFKTMLPHSNQPKCDVPMGG